MIGLDPPFYVNGVHKKLVQNPQDLQEAVDYKGHSRFLHVSPYICPFGGRVFVARYYLLLRTVASGRFSNMRGVLSSLFILCQENKV